MLLKCGDEKLKILILLLVNLRLKIFRKFFFVYLNIYIDASNSTIEGTFIGRWIYGLCIKYWIFVSTGMLLLMSCQNEVVAYRIVYMVLFLYFITVFQVNIDIDTFRQQLYIIKVLTDIPQAYIYIYK